MLDTKHLITNLNLRFREQILDLTANHGFNQVCIGDSFNVHAGEIVGLTGLVVQVVQRL